MAQAVKAPTRRAVATVALQIAQAYAAAGVREQGSNRGDQVEFFQHMMGGQPGDSWCADFVSTCLVKAFSRLAGLPEDRLHLLQQVGIAGHLLPLSGYCPALWHIADGRGMAHDKHFTPSPGDLVLYDFEGQGEPHHVGFVVAALADGTLRACEGNTSAGGTGSQADGQGVFVKVRGRGSVYGFVHFS